ncbi:M-phase inducer phosphatase [Fusarium oxysporum f. sp. albedinis]|nr:M-phase inducer phosphatase [Fusarium oxysporum f. sp. albedinis]
MASYSCPTCDGSYKDILEHICKKHPTEAYTDQQLQPLNLARCPHCLTACQGAQGIKAHSTKIHGIKGTSNISTLPRIRTYPATRAQYQPHPSTIALAKELAARRKRPAKTPSPETVRPSQRQRQQPSSPSPQPLIRSPSLSLPQSSLFLEDQSRLFSPDLPEIPAFPIAERGRPRQETAFQAIIPPSSPIEEDSIQSPARSISHISQTQARPIPQTPARPIPQATARSSSRSSQRSSSRSSLRSSSKSSYRSISQGFKDILLDLETPPSSPPDL